MPHDFATNWNSTHDIIEFCSRASASHDEDYWRLEVWPAPV